LKDAQTKTRACDVWCHDNKSYIKFHSVNPGWQTNYQLTVIINFATSLPPGKLQIEFVKKRYQADDIMQVSH